MKGLAKGWQKSRELVKGKRRAGKKGPGDKDGKGKEVLEAGKVVRSL